MSRFNETKVDSTSGTVEIGAGLTWDKVYVALESTRVNVAGGRNPGLGVSGLTLGGGRWCLFSSEGFGIWISDTCTTGYSYKSSQYELTIDTVTGYELVLPNGTVIIVKTRAWTEVHAVESTVQHHARVYNHTQKSMFDLGADISLLDQYKLLECKDLKIDTTVIAPNVHGQRNTSLPWFWSMDVRRDANVGAWMNDCRCISVHASENLRRYCWV